MTHVINNTCPEDEKTYIHRIGRTGRAGATGIAVTFVDWPDLHRWKMINKALDLPFDEPQETYSTSEHLYHDLGIPAGHQGPDRDPERRSSRAQAAQRDRPRSASRRRARTSRSEGSRKASRSPPAARAPARPPSTPPPGSRRRAATGSRRRSRCFGRATATAGGSRSRPGGGFSTKPRPASESARPQATTTTSVPSGA